MHIYKDGGFIIKYLSVKKLAYIGIYLFLLLSRFRQEDQIMFFIKLFFLGVIIYYIQLAVAFVLGMTDSVS